MNDLHFCLVCHTEGTPDHFKYGIPILDKIRERVEAKTGKDFRVTWALGTFHSDAQEPIYRSHKERFRDYLQRGDELALHPHGVVMDGRMTVDRFVSQDTEEMVEAGFPRPRTFVAGSWSFYPSTLRIIEDLGYAYDASIVTCEEPQRKTDQDGNILYDFPGSRVNDRYFREPYRIDSENVAEEGASRILEVSVMGHLEEFKTDRELQLPAKFDLRWRRRRNRLLDVFEVFWHPWELLDSWNSGAADKRMVERITAYLIDIGLRENVKFSTIEHLGGEWNRLVLGEL